jgi:hypothetical protein
MDNLFTAEGINIVAAEALIHLQDNLVINNLCTTDVSAEYNMRPNGYKVGESISFKVDPVFEAKEFDPTVGVVTQPIRSSNRSLTIEKHLDVTVEVTSKEKALNFEGFSEEVIKPAAFSLAEKVDKYMAGKVYQGHGLFVSTDLFGAVSGTGNIDMAQIRKAANLQQLGMNRFCLLDPTADSTLMGQTWFTGAQNRGNDDILRYGQSGRTMGMDFFSSVNWEDSSHTSSSGTGPLVTAAVSLAAGGLNLVGQRALVLTEITAGFLAGDRIQVAGAKRPMVVAADVAIALPAAPQADRTISLVDPISEILTPEAAVTVVGAGLTIDFHGAVFDSKSLGMAMPMLDAAEGQPSATTSDNGISIRVVMGYNHTMKTSQMSLDCLIGGFALDPRRITLLGESQ